MHTIDNILLSTKWLWLERLKTNTECILFVTTRITKYPLLIERYSKSAIKDRPAEFELLRQAHNFVKDIVKDVNSLVATKEREQRLVEICSKLDPKSTLLHNGKKYRKSDLSLEDRKLMFEGVALLHQRKGSLQVNVIVLSDYMFFLQENNGKFYFACPEGKAALIDVKTLIAKERSGSSKALNFIAKLYETTQINIQFQFLLIYTNLWQSLLKE